MGAELALASPPFHPARVRSLTLSGSGWSPPDIVDEYRKWYDTLAAKSDTPEALKALIESVPDSPACRAETIAALPMPLTGIIGALDDERPYMERIAEARPDFRPVILPGLDHLGTWRSRRGFSRDCCQKRWRANCRARDRHQIAGICHWRHCFENEKARNWGDLARQMAMNPANGPPGARRRTHTPPGTRNSMSDITLPRPSMHHGIPRRRPVATTPAAPSPGRPRSARRPPRPHAPCRRP
jgi:hypothetical protein